MLGTLLIIFAGGLAIDLLQTRYVASVAKGDRLRAAAMSGLITFGSLVLWGTLLQRAETLGLAGAGSLALGAALGTLLGIWRRARRCVDAADSESSDIGVRAVCVSAAEAVVDGEASDDLPRCGDCRSVRTWDADHVARTGGRRRIVRAWARTDLAPTCWVGD
ncbi:MAG: hypothetical protein H6729_10020 [Deltaproteobacteria bacterium]|nr:hypothetical protein [Deltaproteobacteria bacterium]